MNTATRFLSIAILTALLPASFAQSPQLRAPAVPLVAHDPYFSIWAFRDNLTDVETVHWTGIPQPMHSMVRIDGEPYRLMGAEPSSVPAMSQRSVEILPTRTIYTFATKDVQVILTFLTPALPNDLDLLSRPLTYLIWDVKSLDEDNHKVEVYFDCEPSLVVNSQSQIVEVSPVDVPGLHAARMGTVDQPVLGRSGDALRIDWGHAYVGIEENPITRLAIFPGSQARQKFATDGRLPLTEPAHTPQSPAAGAPAIAAVLPLGKVGTLSKRGVCHVLLAYDDEVSLRYFDTDLSPYWRRHGMDAAVLLDRAQAGLASIRKRCEKFDKEFMKSMERVGGREYALMAALAYRQTLAGCKLVADENGAPLLFPKENSSNGCIGTVDVLYPASPFFLLFSPALAKAALVPPLDYAQSDRWTFPFAPHDLGQYPLATGQVYGGGETSVTDQMPVEETANMLLMLAGVALIEGDADFADSYWPLLEEWAEYLGETGWNPGEQLSTDDFTGPMAHNANLSVKSICALAAFAQLCELRGDTDAHERWRTLALDWVDVWLDEAYENGHYRLAFDQPGTWSQKYNLVWDRLLGLNLFPNNVTREEMDHYLAMQLEYGVPLDSRDTLTKLDWICWTACLTGDRADQDAMILPVFKFLNETRYRVPMSDWYDAATADRRGFQARPVVGGLFMPALLNEKVRTKWSSQGEDHLRDWAPIPISTTTE